MIRDIVRIKKGLSGKTGIINKIDGENINVFVTQNNPYKIGIWFNIRELKRIGRVK